jgi:hypothetical protein
MGPATNLANEALLLDLAPELTQSRLEFFGVFDNDSQVRFTSFSPQSRPGADKAYRKDTGWRCDRVVAAAGIKFRRM